MWAIVNWSPAAMAEVRKLAPGFDFPALVKADGANVDSVLVYQPSALQGIARLLAQTPLPVLRDQLLVRSLDAYSAYLPKKFDQENFDFYGTTLNGTPEQEARWKRAVDATSDAMGEAVGKLYVERHFPAAAKERMVTLVANLVEAYRQSISTLDWMGPATRERRPRAESGPRSS